MRYTEIYIRHAGPYGKSALKSISEFDLRELGGAAPARSETPVSSLICHVVQELWLRLRMEMG